jgi:ribosomal protein RSM22 (predicted rRNA methylase)
VIQRGIRPNSNLDNGVGRVGQIGKKELEKANKKRIQKQLQLLAPDDLDGVNEVAEGFNNVDKVETGAESEIRSPEDIENSLRSESFNWPRLVFPPLKRSGHIILDCCTPEG